MPSGGFYGQRIFSFTDKLDLVNRWAFAVQDAERKKLSQLRRMIPEEKGDITRQKQQAGQIWQTSVDLGYFLDDLLKTAITSSQQRGVNPDATIVFATSTLEVGFNDPYVGAVLQHRAPHSLASFVQRKGRAVRNRQMRPWMITITSDYGYDRLAFQQAERFFQPNLKEIDLPVNNYYVRKIQAAFALMDWLSLTLKHAPYNGHSTNVWDLMRGDKQGETRQRWRNYICELLKEILYGTQRETFSRYLQQALSLNDKRSVDALLWDEPRSLLFDVIPTLLRQLESSWQQLKLVGKELQPERWKDNVTDYPMPDFVTPNLFSDLNSPGISVHYPGQKKEEVLPLTQCLKDFAPGNVSKRYSSNARQDTAHWLEIPEHGVTQEPPTTGNLTQEKLSIESLKESLNYDDMPIPLLLSGEQYQLYQPRNYTLTPIPPNITNTSSAQLQWHAHFRPQQLLTTAETTENADEPPSHPLLSPKWRWHNFFDAIHSYTQSNGTWVEVARIATGVQVETRYKNNQESQRSFLQFTANGQAAGIGFVNYYDALCFRLHPLNTRQLLTTPAWKQHYQTLGPQYFLYKLQQDIRIQQAKLSYFESNRLWELELSILVMKAIEQKCSLEDAAILIHTQRTEIANTVMHGIFQSQQIDDDDEDRTGRLHEKFLHLLEDQHIQAALEDCEQVLWEQPDDKFFLWLEQCYASSIGATLFTTLTQLVPDIDSDDLALDIVDDTVWISETTPGGIGIISRLTEILELRPLEFDLQMLDTLQYCEREQLAIHLDMITELLANKDTQLLDIFAQLRRDMTIAEQEIVLDKLKRCLEQQGILTTRELIVALHTKFLRPNSDTDTDDLVATLVHFWHEQEDRLGSKIDLRVVATAILHHTQLRMHMERVLKRIRGAETIEESQIFNIIQSLLWLSCVDSCPDCIEKLHYYQEMTKPSRALLISLLQLDAQVIRYDQNGWKQLFIETVSKQYSASISCSQKQLSRCQQELMELLVTPIEIGYQHFYPVIERIIQTRKQWTISMGIREFTHA